MSALNVPRLGVVQYLNAQPLVYSFAVNPPPGGVEAVRDVPSRLAQMLRDGRVDTAIISSIECFRGPNLVALPGVGICAKGRVLSIKLFTTRDLSAVRTVALDVGSRSAATLTRVLFAELFGAAPEFVTRPPDLDRMLAECDAALLIGDAALRTVEPSIRVYDLGEVWLEFTGLPFVYALWVGRPGAFKDGLGGLLLEARDYGLTHLEEVARTEAARLALDEELCRHYLCDIMRYHLGEEEVAGLRRFVELAGKHGLAPPVDRCALDLAR